MIANLGNQCERGDGPAHMTARLETLRDDRIGASALGCLGFGRGTALPNHPAKTSGFCAGNHLGGITPKQGYGIDGFIRQELESAVAQKGDQQIHCQRFPGQRARRRNLGEHRLG